MRTWLRTTSIAITLTTLLAAAAAPAAAQSPPSASGIVDAVLALTRTPTASNEQTVNDQLYSGRIVAFIIDNDFNNTNFDGGDRILFTLSPNSRQHDPLSPFSGTRAEFDTWVTQNVDSILEILFPASVSESLTGMDVAQHQAQEFLVSTALAAGGRGDIGGRVEFESFDVEGGSGDAVQGLFRFDFVAIEARFAKLSNSIHTKSTNVVVNAHPGWGRSADGVEWRVGGDGFFSTLYSMSDAPDLGAFDYGFGPWASAWKDFSAVSISFAGTLMGSRTYIPEWWISDDFEAIRRVINDRTMRWDFTYGGAAQFPLPAGWTTGVKLLQTASLKSPRDEGRTSQSVLVSFGHLVEGKRALDFGYRYSGGGDRYKSQGFFMNANFGF